MLYFDAASTAKKTNIDELIEKEIFHAIKKYWLNPSSLYQPSVEVRKKINECRKNIADFIGAKPEEVIFTSGATESNNWVIRGWVDNFVNNKRRPHIVTTRLEHKSILSAIHNTSLNAEIHYVNNDEYGMIDLESLKRILWHCNGELTLVSICMANGEIGTIQDIKEISKLVHKNGGILHVDATQALGKMFVDVEYLGIDLLSASGHKLSPILKGIGFLYKKNVIDIQPLIYGSQENGLRGGTENTFGIIGLSKAVELHKPDTQKAADMVSKRNYFINQLEIKFGCKLNGHGNHRLLNNINVTFPQNITGESLLYTLDMSNVCISTGSACNSTSVEPSHVLQAIGLSKEEAMKTIRITLPDDITYEQIDKFIDESNKAIKLIAYD